MLRASRGVDSENLQRNQKENLMTTATSTASGLLRDKVAVVTGAARGIGRAAAIAFAVRARTSSVSISVRQ